MNRKDDPEGIDVEPMRTEQYRLCSVHHKWLKELFIAIRGNGDVKHGLEYKVQTLLDNQETIKKLVWVIVIAVLGKVIASPIWEHIIKHLVNKG